MTRLQVWLRSGVVALVAPALVSCSAGEAWQSSSSASTCSVSTEVYWTPDVADATPDAPHADPPDVSCFPIAVPADADGSTPCSIFVGTGSEPCRADHGTLAITEEERRAVAPNETGVVCRLAQVSADARGACTEPGVCFTRGPAAGACPLGFDRHPAVSPVTRWHVLVRCAWPAACP